MKRRRHSSQPRSRRSESSGHGQQPVDFGSNAEMQAKMARVQSSSQGGSLLVLTSPLFEGMVDGDMGKRNEVQGLQGHHELLGDIFVTRKYGERAVEAHAPEDGVDQVKEAFKANRYVSLRGE